MKHIQKYLGTVFIVFLIVMVYRHWFSFQILSSGDWIYYSKSLVEDIKPISSWDWRHNGMGASELHQLWLESYFTTTLKTVLFIPWQLYERIFWYYPFLIIGFFSSWYSYKTFFPKSRFSYLAPLIYLTNTYILLITSGGQMGVAIAYALLPFPLTYIATHLEKILNKGEKEDILVSALKGGLLFSTLVLFDLRVAYICSLVLGVYFIYSLIKNRNALAHIKQSIIFIIIISTITLLLHSFWIAPLLIHRVKVEGLIDQIYSNAASLSFFSFAKLENSIALLHPNWPENIFGKTYFMKPEFLLFPIIAFTVLFFIPKIQDTIVKYLVLIALVGAFLGKGVNEPFGFVYYWIFEKIPGFVMFRDPTKWYMLLCFTYAMLIPFVLHLLSDKIVSIKNTDLRKNKISGLIVCLFIIIWIITTREAFIGILGGTFVSSLYPQEYQKLSTFLSSQEDHFRTIWFPTTQKFGQHSSPHPAISAQDFFKTHDHEEMITVLEKSIQNKTLEKYSIRYIIVPYDSQKSIFITDRKFDKEKYIAAIAALEKIASLKKVEQFGDIVVFEVPGSQKQFYTLQNKDISIKVNKIGPTKYSVSVPTTLSGEKLVFAESYSNQWEAKHDKEFIRSETYMDLNSFSLPKEIYSSIIIEYKPQQSVNIFLIVSATSLLAATMIVFKRRREGRT